MIFHIEDFIKSLSWTLIHSLWQGLLFATATALILIVGRKASAKLRYNMLCYMLCLFILVSLFTFIWQIQIVQDHTVIAYTLQQAGDLDHALLNFIISATYIETAISFIEHNTLNIAIIWFVLFCLKCFGIFHQFSKLQRIKNHRISPVVDEWQYRFIILKKKLNINQTIAFMESQLITIPCAIGLLKPMILVPSGLLMSLSPDQIEAILLHELAHIKRRDFAINLLQIFVETLFFFNPALLWISSIIREERENCCDDLALSISNDRPSLVRALLSISQGIPVNVFSAAFGGRRNLVLKRAQRILGVKNIVINQLEKIILSTSILCFAIIVFAYSTNHLQKTQMLTEQMEDLPKDFDAYDRELQKDMIAQGIIKDTVGMSYKLSRENFIVNGQLQYPEVHLEFKSKYLKYKNMTATFYNWKFKE